MKLVDRKNIDILKWNEVIEGHHSENIFQYAWYLDAVAPQWSALITENYGTILPVAWSQKLGVKQLIQAPFTREYTIMGDEFTWNEALAFLSGEFKGIHFRSEVAGLVKSEKTRRHQWIDLRQDFEKSYSQNAKRILKKEQNWESVLSTNPNILIELFETHVAHKIDSVSPADLKSLARLMVDAIKNHKGELMLLKSGQETIAAGFFLKDKGRITYLKGAAKEESKKSGAMYHLLHAALKKYSRHFDTFDFGGSEIENVAEFYHKFGATDRIYYDYQIDDLPLWFKTLKKLKR